MKKIMFFAAVVMMAILSSCFKSGLEDDLQEVNQILHPPCELPTQWQPLVAQPMMFPPDSILVQDGDIHWSLGQCVKDPATGSLQWFSPWTGATSLAAPTTFGPLFRPVWPDSKSHKVCPLKGLQAFKELSGRDSLTFFSWFSYSNYYHLHANNAGIEVVSADSAVLHFPREEWVLGVTDLPLKLQGDTMLTWDTYDPNVGHLTHFEYNLNSQAGSSWHFGIGGSRGHKILLKK